MRRCFSLYLGILPILALACSANRQNDAQGAAVMAPAATAAGPARVTSRPGPARDGVQRRLQRGIARTSTCCRTRTTSTASVLISKKFPYSKSDCFGCDTAMFPNSMAIDRNATAWVNYVEGDGSRRHGRRRVQAIRN